MQPPRMPENERERIAELQQLGILDTDAEERFDRYTRLAKRLFDVPIALISLVDTNRQWFKSSQGLDATETPRDISFCGHALLEQSILVVEDAIEDERFHDNPLVTEDPNIRFYAGCPVAGPGGHRLGTLCIIDRVPRSLEAEDLDALRDIAAMAASELAALRLATLDELTGIANRRGFEELAKQALAFCARAKDPVAAVMIDMDGFKNINDSHGHEAGDLALKEFAALLVNTFRDSDVIARIGGDEFCVLLTGATEAQADIGVMRLRRAVERRNGEGGHDFSLAFSAGVAAYEAGHHEGLMDLVNEADSRMYVIKKDKPEARVAEDNSPGRSRRAGDKKNPASCGVDETDAVSTLSEL